MRIVTWNMAGQTLSRETHLLAWRHLIDVLKPDVALVQEAFRLPELEAELGGLPLFQEIGNVGWGSAIWAPGASVERVDLSDRVSPAWMDYARICAADLQLAGGLRFRAISVHPYAKAFDPDLLGERPDLSPKLEGANNVWSCDVAYALAAQLVAGQDRFVVAGDWNTARLFDQTMSYLDPGTGEAFFDRAQNDGWHDCYYARHGREGRTWFRGRDRGYQLDHVFTDQLTGAEVKDCWVDERAAVEPRLSDHAPLIVDLAMA